MNKVFSVLPVLFLLLFHGCVGVTRLPERTRTPQGSVQKIDLSFLRPQPFLDYRIDPAGCRLGYAMLERYHALYREVPLPPLQLITTPLCRNRLVCMSSTILQRTSS